MIIVTREEMDPRDVEASLSPQVHGAVLTFQGTVRLWSEGRKVDYLDYEAYPAMAEAKLREIADEVRQREDVEDIAIYHRIGKLNVGETSLVVSVAAKHRRPGFDACLYTIERIKEIVPIWKKEVWADGEHWVGTEGA